MIKNNERWQQFCQLYKQELVPFFNAYEVKRKMTMPLVLSCEVLFYLCVAVFVISTLPTAIFLIKIPENVTICCFVLGLLTQGVVRIQKNKYKTLLKKNCMQKVLKVFGNIDYYACGDISDSLQARIFKDSIENSTLEKSLLFQSYNRRYDDDLFIGEYENVGFKILETELVHESHSSKKKSRSTIFKGIISLFTSNKNFTGQTIIATKGDATAVPVPLWLVFLFVLPFFCIGCVLVYKDPTEIGAWFFTIFSILVFVLCICAKSTFKLEKIELEDPEIKKHFVVYSNDQVEARYLLTPSFIERFKNLETAYGTDRIKCSFFDNKVMFAIRNRKDLFEIGHIYKSLHDPKMLYTLYNELAAIQAMIKHFKFNEKTGL